MILFNTYFLFLLFKSVNACSEKHIFKYFSISRLIPPKQHSRSMIKAQDIMKLTCIILPKREYHQFWSHAKHNCKGHNLLACRTLSSFVFTQQSYPSISFLNCLPIFISDALWTGHTILLVHSSTSELSNTIYLTCFHFIVVRDMLFKSYTLPQLVLII